MCWAWLALAAFTAPLHAEPMYGHVESGTVAPLPGDTGPKAARAEEPPHNIRKTATPISAGVKPALVATNDTRTLGILLPLSGPNAALGKAMLDAATLALYDMQRNRPLNRALPTIHLAPKDTQGTLEGAQEAFEALVKEEHPVAILGPLFSTELEAVLPLREDAEVPLLAFTNNPRLAARGAYQLGYMAAEQAEMLAAYAKAQKVAQVAGVARADNYGRQILDHLTKSLRERGVEYGPTLLLPEDESAVEEASLAPLIASLKDHRGVRQMLFLAAQGKQLDLVLAYLAKARVFQSKLALAGGGAWDDPQQLRSPFLSGAIFVSTPREGFQSFANKFQSTYGARAPRISGLAYDGVALLTSLIYGEAPLTDAQLQDAQGYQTPTGGLLRFRPDGTAQRRLAIFMATGSGGARAIQNAAGKIE